MNSSTVAPAASGAFQRLDEEWALLCAEDGMHSVVAAWLSEAGLAGVVTEVAGVAGVRQVGLAGLLSVLRSRVREVAPVADAMLRMLLRRAATSGQSAGLAARVVVQAMIPAAARIARGQVRDWGGRSFDSVSAITVAAVYEVACSGRIHTRPGRPAANLTLDTLRHVGRELTADREAWGCDLEDADMLASSSPEPAEHARARGVESAAARAGLQPRTEAPDASRLELLGLVLDALEAGTLLPADARAIAWHYRTEPLSDSAAAALESTSPAAWQRRRARAVSRLRSTCSRMRLAA